MAAIRSEQAGIGPERAKEEILSLFSLLKRIIGGGVAIHGMGRVGACA